ncbi:hypothetical protein HOY82DRAFT_556880 [Tuber indicum]|nr:hypothetical protein HOY82DRAFT_556880 [Tuber indicum]
MDYYQPFVPKSPPEDIEEAKSTNISAFVRVFNDWYLGKRLFRSPEYRDKELTIRMSPSEFLDFKKALSADESIEFPRYSYNSLCSTLNIYCRSSALRDCLVLTIFRGFSFATDILSTDMGVPVAISGLEPFNRFGGRYDGSEKTTDSALTVKDAATDDYEVKFAYEVGLSETYDMLVKEARMWLEGTKTVSAVMIVKIQEDPDYRCPTQNLSDEDFSRLEFPSLLEIQKRNFTLESAYGPAVYKGFTWVGRISGFIEIWRREPVSGLATRIGNRINLFDADELSGVTFWLSDLFQVPDEYDLEISIDWKRFFDMLGSDIQGLAQKRYKDALMLREGLINTSCDYLPPIPASPA